MSKELLLEPAIIEILNERNYFLKGNENKVSYLVMRAYIKNLTDLILYSCCNRRQREAYLLHREGKNNKEIAEQLAIKANHARQLVHQAKMRIEKIGNKLPAQDFSFMRRYDNE